MASAAPPDWSLFDHLAFLLGRWPLLLAGTVLCGGLAYGAGALATTHVVANGLLRIGSAYFVGPLEKPTDVAARVSSVAFLGTLVDHADKVFPEGTRGLGLSATIPEGSSLVLIHASAPTAAEAATLVRLAAKRVVEDHARAYGRVQAVLKRQLADLDKEISHARAVLSGLPQAGDPTARVFAESRRELTLDHLARLRDRQVQDELRADPEVTRPTALVDGPTTRTVSARRKAALAGAAGGLVAAAFLAYFLAWRRRLT